jgi:hypothetical protein
LANVGVGHGVVEDVPITVSPNGNNVTSPINIIWNGIEKGSAVEVSFFIWLGSFFPFNILKII